MWFQATSRLDSTQNEVPRLNSRQPSQTTDFKLCVVCQQEAGPLVMNPRTTFYYRLLEAVKEQASLHDGECVAMQKRLKDCTADSLKQEKAVWHRGCYSMVTNKIQTDRARDRQVHSMSTRPHTPKVRGRRLKNLGDADEVSGSAAPFTRSATQPLNKDLCFFCQTGNNQQLFNVRTINAGMH